MLASAVKPVAPDDVGRITLGGLFFLLLGALLVLLMAMVSAQWNQIEQLRAAAAEQFASRIMAMGEQARAELAAQGAPALADSAALASLAGRVGSRRITLWDLDGRLLLDSQQGSPATSADTSKLRLADLEPLTADERAQLSSRGYLASPRRLPSGLMTRTVWLPIVVPPDMEGRFASGALLALTVEVPAGLQARAAENASWPLLLVFGTALLLLAYYVARSMRLFSGSGAAPGGEAAYGGRRREAFVMGTFAGLIHELKEKEQELARLRSQAEERARHVESYNENVLRSVASGVLTVDREFRITSFNEAAERILGLPRDQVIGQRPADLFGPGHPLTRIIAQTLDRQEWLSRQELELEGPNGQLWVGMSTSLLRDQAGTVLGATIVFTDLTEIKRLQEQVELRRRLAVLGEMSAGIAHEFRNYMGAIMGYARLLSKQMKPDEPGHQMANAIYDELKAMNRLIDDLLQFGRHTDLALQPTDLADLLKRCLGQVATRCAEQQVRVSLTLPPTGDPTPALQLDEGLMRQAVLNLLTNALDAMAGGGTLSAQMKRIGQRDVELAVGDTGAGIAPEHLEKIFLPMFTTKEKGTGLGLALAHKIVLSHGGRISVESKEGGGATFRIVLPVKPPGHV
ncbi:MAG: ATP-binding protein [Nitrospirota bacterium]